MTPLAITPLPTPDELIGRPLPEIVQALATGAVGSVALTKAYLARIAKHDRVHSAYVCVTGDVALAQAQACDAALAEARFWGRSMVCRSQSKTFARPNSPPLQMAWPFIALAGPAAMLRWSMRFWARAPWFWASWPWPKARVRLITRICQFPAVPGARVFGLGAPNSGVGNPLLFTAPANVTGLPALALPAGRDRRGCPIGMQIMAPLNADFALLELGRRLQAQHLRPLSLFG